MDKLAEKFANLGLAMFFIGALIIGIYFGFYVNVVQIDMLHISKDAAITNNLLARQIFFFSFGLMIAGALTYFVGDTSTGFSTS